MKTDIAKRFAGNPILTPERLAPSRDDFEIVSVINPGAFQYEGRIWLLVRVAERPVPVRRRVRFPAISDGELTILDLDENDPDLDTTDPREFKYQGEGYISSISHLRYFFSEDGIHFHAADNPSLSGIGERESYGIEDVRVTRFNSGEYLLTYTAVSACGYGVGARLTRDWEHFEHLDLIFPIPNKDCALFPEKIGGAYLALNRPSGVIVGGHDIWLSRSPDLVHWGQHRCVLRTRPGKWDSARIGVNGPPIRISAGWLVLYHGADAGKRYCLGAVLLDAENPERVLGRSEEPIMLPTADYECNGFFGNVVFSNGHVVRGESLILYYGASDSVTCGAVVQIEDILMSLTCTKKAHLKSKR